MDEDQTRFLEVFLRSLPFMIVPLLTMVGGTITACVYMGKHPREATLTLIAMVLMITATIMGPLLSASQMASLRSNSGNANPEAYQVLHHVRQFINAGAYALLFVAIFGNRAPKEQSRFDDYRS